MLVDLVSGFLKTHPNISSDGNTYFTKRSLIPVRLSQEFTDELCRVVGWIHGDGNMSYRRILISDESLEFHQDVLGPTFQKLFGVVPHVFHDKNRNTYYSHLKNSVLYDFLTDVLDLPRGPVRKGLRVPEYMRRLELRFRAKYVGGLYDGESHVKKRQAEIDFSSTCGEIQGFVGKTLKDLEIGRTLSERQRTSRKFEVYNYGKDDLRKFEAHVGYAHPVKRRALVRALSPPLNTRVVPAVNDAS